MTLVPPKQLGKDERSGPTDNEHFVIVYVCPACGNYYGSSSAGDIENKEQMAPNTARDAGQIRGYRSYCPHCKIPRVRHYARLVPQAETQEIEKQIRAQMPRQTG